MPKGLFLMITTTSFLPTGMKMEIEMMMKEFPTNIQEALIH